MPVQRSPNFPHWTTSTSSPGEQRLTTAASSAPVPEAARMMTSPRVPITSARPARTRSKSASKLGVRWWRIGWAIAWRTSGGIGGGPGARRGYFFMHWLLELAMTPPDELHYSEDHENRQGDFDRGLQDSESSLPEGAEIPRRSQAAQSTKGANDSAAIRRSGRAP